MAALFVPAFILVTGFLLPSSDGVVAAGGAGKVAAAVGWWPLRFAIFSIVALSLFHCAHRIRHTLMDLGMRGGGGALKVLCYGGAAAGCVWLGVVLAGL